MRLVPTFQYFSDYREYREKLTMFVFKMFEAITEQTHFKNPPVC